MTEPRQPQDRKPKQAKPSESAEDDGYFTFTADGEEYRLPRSKFDYITPGYYRRNMEKPEPVFVMSAFALLADNDERILAVLDRTGRDNVKDTQRIINDFVDYLGATPGESEGSSA